MDKLARIREVPWKIAPESEPMTMIDSNPLDPLLTPAEVGKLFRVNAKTVTRWARAGKLNAVRTLGGHRRFRSSEVHRFLEDVEGV